jgi:hypothetical protein
VGFLYIGFWGNDFLCKFRIDDEMELVEVIQETLHLWIDDVRSDVGSEVSGGGFDIDDEKTIQNEKAFVRSDITPKRRADEKSRWRQRLEDAGDFVEEFKVSSFQ